MAEMLNETVVSPRKWYVHVAVQSFEGESWAMVKGETVRNTAVTAEQSMTVDTEGNRERNENSTRSVLLPCTDAINKFSSGVGGAMNSDNFLNIVRECNSDESLVSRVADVGFVLKPFRDNGGNGSCEKNRGTVGGGDRPAEMHYQLVQSIGPLLKDVLEPPVSAVIDDCVDATVLVYGATQEMKHLGVVGTPSACGLLPKSICMIVNKCSQHRKQTLLERAATAESNSTGGSTNLTGSNISGEGTHRGKDHCFVDAEASFIAFDRTNVADLLDLSNIDVEISFNMARKETQPNNGGEDSTSQESRCGVTSTGACIKNARSLPVNNVNDALKALDIGLESLASAVNNGLLPSEIGTSLLFSLTFFTDDGHVATFRIFCLAEDAAVQDWIVSSVLSRSSGRHNGPEPPVLRHNAVALLMPLLCQGNAFASVLLCVYNSVTALQRLSRDLTFAIAAQKLTTTPCPVSLVGRKGIPSLACGSGSRLPNTGQRSLSSDKHKRGSVVSKKERRVDPTHVDSPLSGLTPRSGVCVPLSMDDQLIHEEELSKACQGERFVDMPLHRASGVEAPYSIILTTAKKETRVLLGRSPPALAAESGVAGNLSHGAETAADLNLACSGEGCRHSSSEAANPSTRGSDGTLNKVDDGCPSGIKNVVDAGQNAMKGVSCSGVLQLPSFGDGGIENVSNKSEIGNAKPTMGKNIDYTANSSGISNCQATSLTSANVSDAQRLRFKDILCRDEERHDVGNVDVPATSSASPPQGGNGSEAVAEGRTVSSLDPHSTSSEMELLVDEFICFYRDSCATKDRVAHLERELARARKALEGKRELEEKLARQQDLTEKLREQVALLLAERELYCGTR
ncbi:hypothetical protein, conserved [Trypanosoma brucei gambiense DAL972]|uniref:Kinesin motor domain-containing protein n=2 Tax=Trypanosoma brucei TaxID=5691 RepID=C9ZQS0_TRYB9|nr:hypothetical protein, conserved [Trypanosoma brucei gambiense DAL972]CBH11750.1 hypothetical protein, conserved [Trypanosoma brucei gambiense DAL972]|eukprot:XP_011774035.1 hypothetical protein, conserved [Trypanosoma brucei gambiense DAL972]